MTYEIEKIDGLYCVFRKGRIIAAFTTKKDAVEAIKTYRKGR